MTPENQIEKTFIDILTIRENQWTYRFTLGHGGTLAWRRKCGTFFLLPSGECKVSGSPCGMPFSKGIEH